MKLPHRFLLDILRLAYAFPRILSKLLKDKANRKPEIKDVTLLVNEKSDPVTKSCNKQN